MFSRSNGSWSHMKMNSPEVSIRFAFCLSVSLCGTNREHIFRYSNHRGQWCAPRRVLANVQYSSAINLSVSRRSCVSICRTFSIISGVQLVRWPTRTWLILSLFLVFAKSFESFVNTFSVHGFPPVHPHQHFTRLRCSFLQFVTELDVCTLLHCAVTLPLTLTTFNWPQSVYTAGHMQSMLSVDSPMSLKNHAHARTCAK